ncbi:protein of unknown function [Agreia sp. COWG]|nr:protein of unknown function [Agreia sp. COWG]
MVLPGGLQPTPAAASAPEEQHSPRFDSNLHLQRAKGNARGAFMPHRLQGVRAHSSHVPERVVSLRVNQHSRNRRSVDGSHLHRHFPVLKPLW